MERQELASEWARYTHNRAVCQERDTRNDYQLNSNILVSLYLSLRKIPKFSD